MTPTLKLTTKSSLNDIRAALELIPDNEWCTGTRDNGKGQFCALGHISRNIEGNDNNPWYSPIENELCDLSLNGIGIAPANNGPEYAYVASETFSYQQETPKARTLALLTAMIQAGVQL